MKRKLILTVFAMAILVCLFVIPAYAGEVVKPEWPSSVTVIEGMPEKATFGNDGKAGATSRVLMDDGKVYPAYYVCKDSTTLTFDFTNFSQYNAGNIVAIELPKGITTISDAYKNNKGSSPLTALQAIILPEGCVKITAYAFQKLTTIKYVELPSTLETIGSNVFDSCTGITDVYSKSTIIGEKMFYWCNNIKNLKLENTVEIRNHGFCPPSGVKLELDSLVLPDSVESIGTYAFARAKITDIVLPAKLTTVGSNVFNTCSQLVRAVVLGPTLGDAMFSQCTNLSTLVLTEKLVNVSQTSNPLNNVSSASFTTYYTGTDHERIKGLFAATKASRIVDATFYLYDTYEGSNKAYKFIYGCNLCTVAFGDAHVQPLDDGNCETAVVCSRCEAYEYKAALVHVSGEKLVYADFMKAGKLISGCTNDGCTVGTSVDVEAIFTYYGYSCTEEAIGGSYSMSQFYSVNTAALDAYKAFTGNSFEYGLVASGSANPLSYVEGKLEIADKSFTKGSETFAHDFFGIKINGMSSENLDKAIVFCAYVIDGDKVFYLDAGATASAVNGINYNDVLASLKEGE